MAGAPRAPPVSNEKRLGGQRVTGYAAASPGARTRAAARPIASGQNVRAGAERPPRWSPRWTSPPESPDGAHPTPAPLGREARRKQDRPPFSQDRLRHLRPSAAKAGKTGRGREACGTRQTISPGDPERIKAGRQHAAPPGRRRERVPAGRGSSGEDARSCRTPGSNCASRK